MISASLTKGLGEAQEDCLIGGLAVEEYEDCDDGTVAGRVTPGAKSTHRLDLKAVAQEGCPTGDVAMEEYKAWNDRAAAGWVTPGGEPNHRPGLETVALRGGRALPYLYDLSIRYDSILRSVATDMEDTCEACAAPGWMLTVFGRKLCECITDGVERGASWIAGRLLMGLKVCVVGDSLRSGSWVMLP